MNTVEQYHFSIRKSLFEYDNVANEQRMVIYKQRQELLCRENISEVIKNMCHNVSEKLFHDYLTNSPMKRQKASKDLEKKLRNDFMITTELQSILNEDEQLSNKRLKLTIINLITNQYQSITSHLEQKTIHQLEKATLMRVLDHHWREHLNSIDNLRESINLRSYAQKDPKNEYKKESFQMFSDMLDNIKYEVISNLTQIRIITMGWLPIRGTRRSARMRFVPKWPLRSV